MNYENMNSKELETLLVAVKAEIEARKQAKKDAAYAAKLMREAARNQRKLEVEAKKAAKIAALKAKLEKLEKARTPVSGKTLRKMGAAV